MIAGPWVAAGFLLLSLLLYLFRCRLKHKPTHTPSWPLLEQQWLGRLADLFYFVGLPYLAVISGLLTTRLLGLKGLEHLSLVHFNQAFPLLETQRAITLILFEWLLDSRTIFLSGGLALLTLIGIVLGLRRSGITAAVNESILDVTYDVLHWAFYRALLWFITGDLYLGVLLSTGLVILEMTLGIYFSQREGPDLPTLIKMIVLILTSVVFFYSPNLWLLWLVHLAMIRLIVNLRISPSARHSTLQPR